MKNDIKLIALDMDGTLLDDDHATIPPRNLSALRAAAAQGVEVVIASGRTWSLIEDVAQNLEMVRYVLISNGAAALDIQTGEWMVRFGIPWEQCRAILRVLDARGAAYEVFCEGNSFMDRRNLEGALSHMLSPAYAALFQRRVALTDDLEGALLGKNVEKFHVFHVPDGERDALMAELYATGPFEAARAYATNLEVTSAEADKGKALAGLCAKLGVQAGQVMAFGDADNDLGMLAWAGWSFAMENGTGSAKAAAKYRTGANHDAGVGQAVERYVLGI